MKKSLIYSFVFSVLLLFSLHIIVPDKDFSENENRKLKGFPKFSVESLINGEFRDEFEEYIADQFPLRNVFVGIKSYVEKIIGKKENNDVYIAADDYFIQKMNGYNKDLLNRNVSYINDLAKEYNVSVALAPTALTILKDKLPSFSEYENEEQFLKEFYSMLDDNILKIDLIDALNKHNDEYVYYKTDHHWTGLGAYYAYEEIVSKIKEKSIPLNEFREEILSDSFLGTLYSKGNFFYANKDVMKTYHYDKMDFTINYVYEDDIDNTFYKRDCLLIKDKYSVFFGGNHPAIKITNNVLEDNSKIVIIKDSYANSLVPFLSNHYKEIHMIDLRQFNGDVRAYLDENELKDVLILYNANGLSMDNNIHKLRKRK